MTKNLICLIALFLPLNLLSIQNKFNYITTENGLSQGNITFIFQDSKGYIWFGTFSGLNRFDGYRCKVFYYDPNDTLSLSNERVNNICEDSKHRFWIGTFGGGVSVFYPENNTFRRIQRVKTEKGEYTLRNINGVAPAIDGNIWVLDENGGLFLFDPDLKYIKSFGPDPVNPKGLPNTTFFSLEVDEEGNCWVGAGNGTLCKLAPGSNAFERIVFEDRVADVGDGIKTMFIDKFGKFWIGTTSQGAYNIDPVTGTIVNYRAEDPEHQLAGNTVMDFCEDWEGNLLIALDGGGLNILNRSSGEITFIRYELGNMESLSTNAVYALFIDRSETLWVGTYAGGVCYQGRYRYKFKNYTPNPANANSLSYKNAKTILEDSDGDIWIGTDGGGLNLFNPALKSFRHFRADPDRSDWLHTDVIIHLMQDNDGDIFIGSYAHGLTLFNKQTETFRQFEPVEGDPTSIAGYNAWYIFQDSNGTIWVGMLSVGLEVFDKASQTFRHYTADINNPESLSSPNIKVIFEDSENTLWIGTEGAGLNRYNPDQDNFTRWMLDPTIKGGISNNDIRAIFQDSRGRLWIGTGNGLNQMHRDSTIRFDVLTENDGLPNNVINDLLEDNSGNLWISTNHGITKFNPEALTFRNYDMTDGLQGNEYNYTAATKASTGEFYFGGKNGFNVFRPEEITDNPHIPEVVLTDFQIFNKSVDKLRIRLHGKKQLVSVSQLDEIKLSYKQNVIGFEFAALDFGNPAKNKYKYILEGFEKEWNEVSSDKRFASYTNLSGGEYTFRVKAANSDGLWNETGLSIRLIITPPFWQRAWFIILISALILYITYLYFRARRLQVENDKAVLEGKIREGMAELEKQKKEVAVKDKALQDKLESEKEQNWYNTGMLSMSEVMSRDKDDLFKLGQGIISRTVEYLEAQQGAIYLLNDDKDEDLYLELIAAYAPDEKRFVGTRFEIEEGQVGACFREQQVIRVDNLPEGYASLMSGLGEAAMKYLALVPLRLNENVVGVIELLSFEKIPDFMIHFIEKAGETLTSILTTLKANEKTKKLLEAQKSLAEEMAAQEEELRQNLEEMQATQEELNRMRESEKKLVDQLKHQNDTLVEQQEALQKEQYLFNALLNNIKESVYFKNKESRFIRLSKSMLHLFKANDFNEVIGKWDFDFFDDEHARPAYEGEQEIIRTGDPIIDLIEKEVHKDGTIGWVTTTKMPLIDQNGNIVGTWGISKDISESIRMEHEIKQRNEELLAQEEELRQNLEEMQTTQEEIQRMRENEQMLMEQLKQQNDALVEKQEALQKEQYLFSALLDNAKESIYFKDTESRFVRLSRSMMHLFKVKDLNELIGKSDFDFFDDEHARPAYDGEQEIIKTGKPIIDLIEKEVQKDGSVSWVNTSKMPLIDQDGNIVGTWGISKDISDFIRMEHEIKQRNEELLAQEEELRQNLEEMQTTQEEIERMRVAEKAMAEHVNQQNEALLEANKNLEFENIMFTTLMDNLAARVTYKDTEARHIRINETKVKALGIKDQSEIFGKTDPEVFGKTHTIERLNKEIQQIKKGEATVHKVELFIQKDGESHWGDTSRYPLKNKQGDIIGGLVITWDITDQKNIQSRLELMNLIMRNVSKDLPVILFNSTENGEIVEISGKALQLLGLKEEKTAGGKLQDLIPEIKKSFADAKEKDLFQSTGKVKSGKSEYHYKYLLIKSKATTGGFTGYIILENA